MSSTIARRSPMSRLNNEDLPTLGRPTRATIGFVTRLPAGYCSPKARIAAAYRNAHPLQHGDWHKKMPVQFGPAFPQVYHNPLLGPRGGQVWPPRVLFKRVIAGKRTR